MKPLFFIFLCEMVMVYATYQNVTKVRSKIYNGQSASKGQFPYMAKLLFRSNYFTCGGFIIHNRWVVTAAHCLITQYKPTHVEVGNHLLRPVFRQGLYKIERLLPHKKYDETLIMHDVGLIRTKTEMNFNYLVQPISLAEDDTNLYDDYLVTGSGWGETENKYPKPTVLQYVEIKVLKHTKCKQLVKENYYYDLSKTQLCTSTAYNKRVCMGDSGSPLVTNNTVVAIVSFTFGLCQESRMDINTRVSSYVSWIKNVLKHYGNHID